MKIKKLLSCVLTAVMLLNVILPFPVNAESNNKTYFGDGYTVQYDVTNSWLEGETILHQQVSVTITNTSGTAIENWKLYYDFNGEIENIWNAVIETDENGNKFINNAGYNSTIYPGSSVNYGCSMISTGGMPDTFSMASKEDIPPEIEIPENKYFVGEGYTVDYSVVNSWLDGETSLRQEISVTITNTGEEAIDNWKLYYNFNGDIENIWNAVIETDENGKEYISDAGYNFAIYPYSSVNYGYIMTATGELPDTFSMTSGDVPSEPKKPDGNKDEVIGYAYFKDIESPDELAYDSNGDAFVLNQLLVTAYENIPFEMVAEWSDSINAEIVGYIELTNDYQIEFKSGIPVEELYILIDELNSGHNIIEYASLNAACEIDTEAFYPNDAKIQPVFDNVNNVYINTRPENENILMINADDVWADYFIDEANGNLAERNIVRIGVIDSIFDNNHDDVKFKNIWNNDTTKLPEDLDHGTAVAGIIGAEYNNGKGIAGISPTSELYAYALAKDKEIQQVTVMEFKLSFATLIGNNIKVVNFSIEALSNNGTEGMGRFLNSLLNRNYDFLIVAAAANKGVIVPTNDIIKGITLEKVKDRIIIVGGVNQDKTWLKTSLVTSNYGKEIDVLAPGERTYSTFYNNNYNSILSGTSMSAPHVSGIAGMMLSVNPNLTGADLKNIIKSTATEVIYCPAEISGDDYEREYYLADASAAVDEAAERAGISKPDPEGNAIITGTISFKNKSVENNNDKPFKIVEIKKDGKSYKADYEIMENNADDKTSCQYVLYLTEDGDYTISFSCKPNGESGINYKATLNLPDFKVLDGENYVVQYIDVELGKECVVIDWEGKSIFDAKAVAVKASTEGEAETVEIQTDENGGFTSDLEDGVYTVTLTKEGYEEKTLQIEVIDGIAYDEDGNVLDEIMMTPTEITISGTITEYNTKTKLTKPISGFEAVLIAINEDGEENGIIASGITGADGKYEIITTYKGACAVKFTEDKQILLTVQSGEYTADMQFTVDEDEEDGDGDEDGDEDGNGDEDGSNDFVDDSGNDIDMDFSGDEDTGFTIGDYNGNLHDGIWLKTSNGTNDYYVHLYVTDDSGEYTSTFGSPGFGIYTTRYHYWTNKFIMETFRADGAFIQQQNLDYFYNKTYIYFPDSHRPKDAEVLPLMQIDAITSALIKNNGVTYNMYTDGYYKGVTNIIGSLGLKKEKWEDNKTRTVSFYNKSKLVSASSKSPF